MYNGSLVGQLYAFNGLPEIAVSANDINVEKQEGMVEVSINIITPDELPYYINKQCAIQNAEYVSTASGNMNTPRTITPPINFIRLMSQRSRKLLQASATSRLT